MPSISEQIHPSANHIDNVYPLGMHLNKSKRNAVYYNRAIYGFSTLNFGGTVNIQLNNNALYSDTYISLTFGPGTLRQLPAYQAIKRIEYIVSGSQPISLNMEDMMLFNLDQAETDGKRSEQISLAGGNGGVIAANTTYYIPLAFPWSKIACANKLPFDSTLCGQVKLYIYLNDSSAVYSAGAQSALVAGTVIMRMAELPNSEDKIVLAPNQVLNYPHPFLQSFVSVPFTPASTTTVNPVYLTGFRSGSLVGLLMRSIDVSNYVNARHVFNLMSNIKITLNGAVLYQYDNENWKLATLFENKLPTKVTVNSVDYWYVHVNFTQTAMKNKDFGLEYQHGVDYRNMQVLVEFTSASTNQQVLECCYVYNGNLLVSNGNAEIIV